MKQYDAIIIGFGKGGKTLAAELAKRNENVAVIERSDEMYGGTYQYWMHSYKNIGSSGKAGSGKGVVGRKESLLCSGYR